MASRIEISLKPELPDAEGEALRRKARDYFGIAVEAVRTVHIVTIDAALAAEQLRRVQTEIFTNPVTQISSPAPLAVDADWIIWVGLRPGVRDNAGATAIEAMEDLLGQHLAKEEAVYTSKRYCLKGGRLTEADIRRIASE
ncbi:MAG: phosphoribosylformylglycinamidine synthase subunit PurS, partial [Desulfatitalea sp.]